MEKIIQCDEIIFLKKWEKIIQLDESIVIKKCEKIIQLDETIYLWNGFPTSSDNRARERRASAGAGVGGDGDLASEHDARILWFVGVRERNSDCYEYVGLVQKSIHNCVHFI